MATTSPQLAPKRTLVLLPAIARLAWWRFKRMWLVLFVTWLGMLTMVMRGRTRSSDQLYGVPPTSRILVWLVISNVRANCRMRFERKWRSRDLINPSSLARQMQHNIAPVRARTVLEHVDALPGAERQPSLH